MQEIIIYTDGACKYNPGPGGYAAIVFDKNNKKGIKGREIITTNNIMELTAVLEALKWTIKYSELYKNNNDILIKVHSDSSYVVNAIKNGWIYSWEKKGWRNSGGVVKNLDLWKEMYELLNTIKNLEFVKVKGHSTDKYNNLCDKYAVMEAELAKNELIEEASAEGINLNDENIADYIKNISGDIITNEEENDLLKTKEDISFADGDGSGRDKVKDNIDIKDFEEKEERQADTIASLVIENSKLKTKIRLLEEKIKELEEK